MAENKPIVGKYARVCCVRKCPVCGAECALVANTRRSQFECVTGLHFFENNHGEIRDRKESLKSGWQPNRCLNEQRLQKLEKCESHGRNGNIACQFCGISIYYPDKGFTCEA